MGHHPITPVVIIDPANGIAAAHAGVDMGFWRRYLCRVVWHASATLPHQPCPDLARIAANYRVSTFP